MTDQRTSRSLRSSRLDVAVLAGIVLVTAAVACDHDGGPRPLALALALERWEQRGPADYRFDYQLSCFCHPAALRPLRVEVRARVVARATYTDTDQAVPEEALADVPTIDDLLGRIVEAVEAGAYLVDASYDDRFGYPRDVFIDRDVRLADDEVGLEVSDFVPLSGGTVIRQHGRIVAPPPSTPARS